MADKEKLDEIADDLDEHVVAPSPKKAGFLPLLLKWIAVVVAAVIFIVTVVVITTMVMSGRGNNHTGYPVSQEYRPTVEALQTYSVGLIRTNTAGSPAGTVAVKVDLGYTQNDKATQQELLSRQVQLKDFLRSFFQSKTVEQLRQEQKIKIEIRNEVNDTILSKTKIKEVFFEQYDVLEDQ